MYEGNDVAARAVNRQRRRAVPGLLEEPVQHVLPVPVIDARTHHVTRKCLFIRSPKFDRQLQHLFHIWALLASTYVT